MSKGLARRSSQVSDEIETESWDRIFKRKPEKTLDQAMRDEFERPCCGTMKGSPHRTTCTNHKLGTCHE